MSGSWFRCPVARLFLSFWKNIVSSASRIHCQSTCVTPQLAQSYVFRTDENMMGNYVLVEVVDGLKMYFERALPKILLYRNERQQYAEWKRRHPSMKLVDVYGSEHLLRLFGKLMIAWVWLFHGRCSSIANVDFAYCVGCKLYQ